MPSYTNVLGVKISAVNMAQTRASVAEWVATGQQHYITVTGVHGVMESQRDPALRRIHNRAGLVVPEGMPIVWASQLAGHGHVSRVYGPDLMLALCAQAGYRHFFYGGAEGVPQLLAQTLTQRYPQMQVVGTHAPPFRPLTPDEDAAICQQINAAGADILWVGLGTPKQERWMAAHRGLIETPVMIGVGAAFDFNAGLKPQAPRWMQRTGLEWSFRLLMEPRRLAPRYLVNNPLFLLHAGLQATGLRRYPVTEDAA